MRTIRIAIVVSMLMMILVSTRTGIAQQVIQGAIVRGDTTEKKIALAFSAHEFADGADTIINTLWLEHVKASFFFTGKFYRTKKYRMMIYQLKSDGHYLGPHSNSHLLYCDWTNRDSLLVTQQKFSKDLRKNYKAMERHGIFKGSARYFLPPYEWYNQTIADWTRQEGLQLVNFTHGTLSNADYTTPDMKNYRSSEVILESIKKYEASRPAGLNGFILLLHFGTDPQRTDKLYDHLRELIRFLKGKGYQLVRINELHLPNAQP